MQVLVAYPFPSEIVDRNRLIYLPELVANEEGLRVAIREHRPDVIIVGNNSVQRQTLEFWRQILGNSIQLTIIRRGSSLSRIDVERAKQLNINVLNTLSVNSRFVALYMIEHLHLANDSNKYRIGIIGSGAIGSRIADRLSTNGHIVHIYSPSLTEPDQYKRKAIERRKGIDSTNIHISMTPIEAIKDTTHILIAVDADRVTNVEEQLSKEFFQLIPNGTRLVSVSEFRVFAEGSIEILIERCQKGELSVRLDSHPYDIDTIKIHPPQLEIVSAAMKYPGCGHAMDQAALIVLADLSLQQTFKSPLSFSIYKSNKCEDITIIGAGILGLVTGFVLSECGYIVDIVDEHDRPSQSLNGSNKNEICCRGPTLDGCDARHASLTETMPHAVFYRKDSLVKYPKDHQGWRIIPDQFDLREKKWIDKFSELAGYPELIVQLISQFVANINRRGIELWEDIFQNYPQISANAIKTRRLLRICSSLISLNVTTSFQTKYHKTEDYLQRFSHGEVLQKLPSLKLNDGDAGAIEVPGFAVNHLKLCQNLIEYLETKTNVHFKWSTHMKSIDEINSSKLIFASSLNRLDSPFLSNVLTAVQGVLGCWTKIPNTNSIKNAFKITEKEPVGVINVTPSNDEQYLYITGAFAFVGHRGIIKSTYLDQLVDLFYSAIRSYLPNEMEAAETDMLIPKYCIRPMTPDGMPILTKLNNQSNNKQEIYFIGGTNSAGFVQSPILALLLLDLIQGSNNQNNLSHIYRSLRIDRNTLSFN